MSELPVYNDNELFTFMRERLYAAVLSDALDQTGYREQAIFAPTSVLSTRMLLWSVAP